MREVARPPNQLQLSASELEEEVGRSLTAGNPAAPANVVRYNFRERGYRAEPIIDQQLLHLSLGGSLMHRESDEAARERHRLESAALAAQSRRVTAQSRRVTHAAGPRASEMGGGGGLRAEASLAAATSSAALAGAAAALAGDDDGARLRNSFNFADRAAQTAHAAPRERGTMTEPPPTATTAGSCSRWEIFEAYVADQDRQRQTEELARQKAQVARREARAAAAGGAPRQQLGSGGGVALPDSGEQVGWGGWCSASWMVGRAALSQQRGLRLDEHSPLQTSTSAQGGGGLAALSGEAARLMERMVSQNLHQELIMDFKAR